LISIWLYRPARPRVSTSCEMSVAVISTARSGAASSRAIAMLYGSWPVEQAADHTRIDVNAGRSRTSAGTTCLVRVWK